MSHEGRPAERLERGYTNAVLAAGAVPLVLPSLGPPDAEEVMSVLDGLLLSGGGDVAASWYGQVRAPEAYGVDTCRDAWEVALVRTARATGVPVLGVCRGAQVVNVAAGGTLVQHLPAITDHPHREYERDRELVHTVDVDPDSVLARVTGQRSFGVNSLHHQAIAEVGPGLRAVAWAPDGIIEAVESRRDHEPLLAVQWHPELLADQVPHGLLFTWLARAAADHRGAMASARAQS